MSGSDANQAEALTVDSPALDTAEQSPSYLFEPQGELLNQRERVVSSEQFIIPDAIGDDAFDLAENEDPHGLSSGCASESMAVPPPVAGEKRKSMAGPEDAGLDEERQAKRPSIRTPGRGYSDDSNPQVQRSMREPARRHPRNQAEQSNHGRREAHEPRRTLEDPSIPMILPASKVFPIQVGDKLFRLSGASISSDAPSYFSQFFREQLRQSNGADDLRTLYIDRDPATFEDISLHLQGYHIQARDSAHFIKLFADAQFFSLPKLKAQLNSEAICIRIGGTEFQISRDLLNNPGDTPNYFNLSVSMFLSSPDEVFPGLSQQALLRPPPMLPPSIPHKSARTFADLLHILKGYPIDIRDAQHRAELLRDARYYHFKGLEQRLIAHEISYNLKHACTEILIQLDDVRQSGVSLAPLGAQDATKSLQRAFYQRPYADQTAHMLTLETTEDDTLILCLEPRSSERLGAAGRPIFQGRALERFKAIICAIKDELNDNQAQTEVKTEASTERVSSESESNEEDLQVCVGQDADVTLDGKKWIVGQGESNNNNEGKRHCWVVGKAHWRLDARASRNGRGPQIILHAVKLEAFTNERERNAVRKFLG